MANNRPAADRYTAYPVSYLAQKTLWVEHTHWSELAQDPDHQDRFQNEECHEEDEGEELIQYVECDISIVIRWGHRKLSGPVESSI